jgi:hypothetical protein
LEPFFREKRSEMMIIITPIFSPGLQSWARAFFSLYGCAFPLPGETLRAYAFALFLGPKKLSSFAFTLLRSLIFTLLDVSR